MKQVLLDTLPLFLATGKGVLNDGVPQAPWESCGAFMGQETAPGACEDPPQAKTMTTATENQPAIVRSHLISMNNNGATKQPQ